MNTFIAETNSLAIIALLFSVVAIACWMETRPRIGQFAVIGIIFFCMLLNGLHVLPHAAPIYKIISQYFVPLAIPLMLFNADIKRIWQESGRVFIAFFCATFATVVAAILAINLTAIHADESLWAGIVAAGFIGSSGNTVAVAAALDKSADPFFGLLLASMYVVTVPFVALMLALPSIPRLWHWFSPYTEKSSSDGQQSESQSAPQSAVSMLQSSAAVTTSSLSACLALSALICWIGDYLAEITAFAPMKFLAISLISIMFASLLPRQAAKLHGHQQVGHILLYMIFAIIGVQVDFSQALASGGQIMLFAFILLSGHLIMVALLGRLLKIAGPELLIASNACLLGPPTAAAMAASRGWNHLITPGILCGVLGYAVANFIGIAFGKLI